MDEMQIHELSLKMFKYYSIRRNSQPSHKKIPCNNKNIIIFFKGRAPSFVLAMFTFCDQNRKDCGGSKKKR
jgi:hypothetical protein